MKKQEKKRQKLILTEHKNADTHINVTMKFGDGDGKISEDKFTKKQRNIGLVKE